MTKLRMYYGRHYCNQCHGRVFPYEALEKRTEEPGGGILLTSLNARRRAAEKPPMAWCWACGRFVDTYQETLAMLQRRYARRKGVRVRPDVPRGANILHLRRRSA